MAEEAEIKAPFPAPPPFYTHFTKDNVARVRQLRKEAGIPTEGAPNAEQHRDLDILSLPPELRYLIPPEPPQDGKFTAFGTDLTTEIPDATLADANIEQLYPSHPSIRLNPQPHLIALARSTLTTFLSLTGILGQDPEKYLETAQALQTIVFNMHHLINQYRPHQARETLILLMEQRLEQMKDEIADIDKGKEKVVKLLQDLQKNGMVQALQEEQRMGLRPKTTDWEGKTRQASQQAAWAALEDEIS